MSPSDLSAERSLGDVARRAIERGYCWQQNSAPPVPVGGFTLLCVVQLSEGRLNVSFTAARVPPMGSQVLAPPDEIVLLATPLAQSEVLHAAPTTVGLLVPTWQVQAWQLPAV
jgi:hypothetical protein